MSDEPKTRRVAIRQFSCPHHPEGPPTLPADGYEREELTLEQAYDAEEIAALRVVVARSRERGEPEADHVERMFGLCCAGHTWKVVSWRWMTPSEETVATATEALLRMYVPAMRSFVGNGVLLKELEVPSDDTNSVIRVPLIVGKQLPKTDAARAADEADRG